MVRLQYTPNKKAYDLYYSQKGGNIPVFRGRLSQKGYGLGGILGSIVRRVLPVILNQMLSNPKKYAIPLVKKGAIELGKHALKTGAVSIADVITKKKSPKQAISDQTQEVTKKLAEIVAAGVKGNKKKRPAKSSKPAKKNNKKKKLNLDIFS